MYGEKMANAFSNEFATVRYESPAKISGFLSRWQAAKGRPKSVEIFCADLDHFLRQALCLDGWDEVVHFCVGGGTPRSGMMLADPRMPRHLETLHLSFCNLIEAELRACIQGGGWGQLRELALARDVAGDDWAKVIATEFEPRDGFQVLEIEAANLSDHGLALLANSKRLSSLRALRLPWNSLMTDQGIETLCRSMNFPHIVELDLSVAQVSPRAIEALAHSALGHNLRRLDLAVYTQDQGSFRPLRDLLLTGRLEWLDLTGCPLTEVESAELVSIARERSCEIVFDTED